MGAVDLLGDCLRGGHVPTGNHLRERNRRRARIGRLGEERRQLRRYRPAVAVEARQERRLSQADDIAGDPHHHVMEATVLEVILDPGATRPGDCPVDDIELAVIGPPDLVLPPIDPLPVGVEAVPVGRKDIVDDDLRSSRGKTREHLPRLLVRPGAEAVHDHPHLDPRRQLLLQERGHPHADFALAPAEHQDVHGRLRSLDVGEDPREEVDALCPRLDRRRGGPGERQRGIVRARGTPCDESLGGGSSPGRCDCV